MAGNVWEWTLDRERPHRAARVIRGGAAYSTADELVTFRRQSAPPEDQPTESDRAWFFKLFSLRCVVEGEERMCFFTYLQKSDDSFDFEP